MRIVALHIPPHTLKELIANTNAEALASMLGHFTLYAPDKYVGVEITCIKAHYPMDIQAVLFSETENETLVARWMPGSGFFQIVDATEDPK